MAHIVPYFRLIDMLIYFISIIMRQFKAKLLHIHATWSSIIDRTVHNILSYFLDNDFFCWAIRTLR